MADKIVQIAKDPVKERLKTIAQSIEGRTGNKPVMSFLELENAVKDILEYLKING